MVVGLNVLDMLGLETLLSSFRKIARPTSFLNQVDKARVSPPLENIQGRRVEGKKELQGQKIMEQGPI